MYIEKHYINGVEATEEQIKSGVPYKNMTTKFICIPDKVEHKIEKVEVENIIISNINDNTDIDKLTERAILIYKYRNNKDYKNADRIRNELIKSGYTVSYK